MQDIENLIQRDTVPREGIMPVTKPVDWPLTRSGTRGRVSLKRRGGKEVSQNKGWHNLRYPQGCAQMRESWMAICSDVLLGCRLGGLNLTRFLTYLASASCPGP